MRALPILLALRAVAAADSSAPAPRAARWAACRAALESARQALIDDGWSVARWAELEERSDFVELRLDLGGSCMHHGAASIRIERVPGPPRRWHQRRREYGFVSSRRTRSAAATVEFWDHDESESGSVDGFDEPFFARMIAAADLCLRDDR